MLTLLNLLSGERMTVGQLETLYLAHRMDERLDDEAFRAFRLLDPEKAWRGAWLLQRAAKDRSLHPDLILRLAESAEEATHWAARLCLCHVFVRSAVPEPGRDAVIAFLCEAFRDRRVIIRAWALTALLPFRDHPLWKTEIAGMVQVARRDPAKAMQARLRHLPLGTNKTVRAAKRLK